MVSVPKLELVEFYHHRGGEVVAEDLSSSEDADRAEANARRAPEPPARKREEVDRIDPEGRDSGRSWLRIVGGLVLLGGAAFVLNRRRGSDTDADTGIDTALDDVRRDDPASRLRESDDAGSSGTVPGPTTTPASATDVGDTDDLAGSVDLDAVDTDAESRDTADGADPADAESVGSGVDIDSAADDESIPTVGDDPAATESGTDDASTNRDPDANDAAVAVENADSDENTGTGVDDDEDRDSDSDDSEDSEDDIGAGNDPAANDPAANEPTTDESDE